MTQKKKRAREVSTEINNDAVGNIKKNIYKNETK